MGELELVQDLAVVLLAAGLAGALCKRLGLSVVVGYVLAGIVIGPHTPPFPLVADVDRIQMLSQIGLVFLMFGIGLGLSLTRIQRLGVGLLIATALGAFGMLQAGRLLGGVAGWSESGGWFLAGMLMVSSSAVIAKIVGDMNLLHARTGQVALAVTVMEDVVAVIMLAVLGAQAAMGGGAAGSGGDEMAWAGMLAGLSAFVVLLVSAGLFFLPKVLRRLNGRADPELQTIVVAGVLLALAWLAAWVGYSPALGAFLLGTMVAEMPQRPAVEKAFAGLRDMFSSVFFVAIGMMIEVELLAEVGMWALGLGVFTIVVRTVVLGAALILTGEPAPVARRAGLLLSPIGEFSFVIAQLGVAGGILSAEAYPLAVGASLFTVLVAPLINRRADGVLALWSRAEPLWMERGFEAYRLWVERLARQKFGGIWWRLSKKRVIQIAGEMLLVTGIVVISRQVWEVLQASAWAADWSRLALRSGYVAAVAVLTVVPLVALGRNLEALGLISADAIAMRTKWPARVLSAAFRIAAVVVMVGWLWILLPLDLLPGWAWLAAALIVAAVVMLLFRRLIFWHSQWQHSVEGAFAGEWEAADATISPRWWGDAGEWALTLQECILSERAACAGQRLMDVNIRKRFGCTVAEIDRQGFIIATPGPQDRLFPGDRLLLLGDEGGLQAARKDLDRETESGEEDFDDVRLHLVVIEATLPKAGRRLDEWQTGERWPAIVVGIERDGRRITQPDGQEVIGVGDRLLLLGTPAQVRTFLRMDGADGSD